MTPTELSKIVNVRVSNLSVKLNDLAERGLIECKNPLERKGRLYARTAKGDKVKALIG